MASKERTQEQAEKPIPTRDRWKKLGKNWGKKWGIRAAICLVLYTLFGFFIVPVLIRKVVVPQIEKRINGTITLTKARTNPFTFNLELETLEVKDASGTRVFALDHFRGNFELATTLVSRGWHFDAAVATRPFIAASVQKDHTVNLLELIKRPANTAPSEPLKRIPRIVIANLAVVDASLNFEDHSLAEPFADSVKGLNFTLNNLDTHPDKNNVHTMFATTASGATIGWSGDFHVDPLSSRGTIRLARADLSKFMPYLSRFTDGRIAAGTFTGDIMYEVAPARAKRIATFTITAATIEAIRIEQGGVPVLAASEIVLRNAGVDVIARTASVKSIEVRAPFVTLKITDTGDVPAARLANIDEIIAALPSMESVLAAFTPTGAFSQEELKNAPMQQLILGTRDLIERIIGPWSINADAVRVSEGTVSFIDESARSRVVESLSDLGFEAGPCSTSANYTVPFKFNTKVGQAGSLKAAGELSPFDKSLDLTVEIDRLNLATVAPYLPERIATPLAPGNIARGELSMSGTLAVRPIPPAASESAPTPTPHGSSVPAIGLAGSWDGTLALRGITMLASDDARELLVVESVELKGKARATTLDLTPDGLSWDGAVALTNASGEFTQADSLFHAALGTCNIQGTLAVTLPGSQGQTQPEPSATFQGSIDASSIKADAPSLQNASATLGRASMQSISLRVPDNAATIESIEAQTLALAVPDWNQAAATIERAAIGNVSFAMSTNSGTINSISAAGINAAAPGMNDAKVAVATFGLTAAAFNGADKTASIERITIDGPHAELVLDVLPTGTEKAAERAAPQQLGGYGDLIPIDLRLGELVIANASGELRDDDAQPPAILAANEVAITLSNIEPKSGKSLSLDMSGKIQQTGRLIAAGTVNVFSAAPEADLAVKIQSVPLKPYDPFFGRYLGYVVDQGRATVSLPVQLKGDELKTTVDLTLDRFYLGQSVPSPDAPSIPIKLGLALLRDSNEQVTAKVPISGKINDPQFSVGGLIWRAVFGLITKAATAPFQVLASIFGGGEQDISYAAFESGTSTLTAEGVATLDTIARAMKDRPALKLAVRGVIDPEQDTKALRPEALRAAMLKRAQESDKRLQALSADQYRRQIERAYRDWEREQPKPESKSSGSRQPAPTFEQMEQVLLETVTVSPESLAALEAPRAQAIIAALEGEHGIAPERLRIARTADASQTETTQKESGPSPTGPRAEFTLE